MKRSKLFAITLQSKSGLIFFFVLAAYNLLLGVYLKDFFVLSPMLVTLYLLSALPTLFFVLKIRSAPMRAIVCVVLFFVMIMSIGGFAYCSRLLSIMTMVTTIAELIIHLLYWLYHFYIYEGGIKMTNESCRSKRRCLLSSLQGSSPLVRIAEYRKRAKNCTASYSTVIKPPFCEGQEETNANDLITKMELFVSDPRSLYLLNQELAARVYTAPSLVL